MTGISRIECLFDDLINYTENGQRRLIISVFENKVFFCLWSFMNEKLLCFIRLPNKHPTNIYIPHNVQLVVFISFSITTETTESAVANIYQHCVYIETSLNRDVCEIMKLSVRRTYFRRRNDINDQIFPWELSEKTEELEQARMEKICENIFVDLNFKTQFKEVCCDICWNRNIFFTVDTKFVECHNKIYLRFSKNSAYFWATLNFKPHKKVTVWILEFFFR